jgi:hypothetical protein
MARFGLGSQLPRVYWAGLRCIDLHKPERGIEWSVPGQVTVSCQREAAEALGPGVIRRRGDQCGTDPLSLVRPGDRYFRDVKLFVQRVGGEEGDRFIRMVDGHPDRSVAAHRVQQGWFYCVPVSSSGC